MAYVAPILAGAAVGVGVYAVLSLLFAEERRVRSRLSTLSDYEFGEAARAEPMLRPFAERVLKPGADRVADLARALLPSDYKERLRRDLSRAGNPRGIDADRFIAAKTAGVFAAVLLTFVLAMLTAVPLGRMLLIGLVWGLMAFFLPDVWLKRRIAQRRLRIRKDLPDMLDMLTISVEAGLGFDAAVAKVVKNSPGPLSEEFGKMLQELQAGIARRDAFRHLAERTDVLELNAFVMQMVQADVFGVSVANVLRIQAGEMRTKRRQLAEELAQKAPVKIVFPLVLCILPATMIVILGPAVVSIGRAFGMVE